MHFEILSEISAIETFAAAPGVPEIRSLAKRSIGAADGASAIESGEDYLHLSAFFRLIAPPLAVKKGSVGSPAMAPPKRL